MIICNEKLSFINEYGYEQSYSWKEVTMSLSGHLWRGSSMETDDSCGNCDGGRCNSCREIYEVFLWGELKHHIDPETGWHLWDYHDMLDHAVFYDREEALEYYKSLEKP